MYTYSLYIHRAFRNSIYFFLIHTPCFVYISLNLPTSPVSSPSRHRDKTSQNMFVIICCTRFVRIGEYYSIDWCVICIIIRKFTTSLDVKYLWQKAFFSETTEQIFEKLPYPMFDRGSQAGNVLYTVSKNFMKRNQYLYGGENLMYCLDL